MDDMLLRKVEELTLYTIRQETELVAKGNEIKLLKAESELLKAQIAELAELKLLVKELLDK
jgi:intracellular sulfur oxidation DsrE/DsrF family protein